MALASFRPYVLVIVLWALTQALPRAASAQQTPTAPSQQPTPPSSAQSVPPASSQATTTSSLADSFFAQTKATSLNQNASGSTLTYHYSLAFPTNATADLLVTLQVNQSYTPTAEDLNASATGPNVYGLTFSNTPSSNGSANSATLNFFVPYSSLSPDVVKQLQALANGSAGAGQARTGSRLLNVGYLYGGATTGQPAGPQDSNSQGEQGVSVSEAAKWFNSALTDVEAFMEGLLGENPLEGIDEIVSLPLDINEALTLNADDTALLGLMNEYQYCAHNSSVLYPQGVTPQLADPQVNANAADQILADTRDHIGAQFVIKMADVAVDNPVVKGIFSIVGLTETASDMAKEDLNNDLQRMQQLLPYCRGMWYGSYQTTFTSGDLTVTDSGVLRFSVLGNPGCGILNGSVTGHYKYSFTFSDTGGQKVEQGATDYTAPFSGSSVAGLSLDLPDSYGCPVTPNLAFSTTGVASVSDGPSFSPPNFQTQVQDSLPGEAGNYSNTQPVGAFEFNFMLSDGQTTTGLYPNPDPAQNEGVTGQFTVTVHKLP